MVKFCFSNVWISKLLFYVDLIFMDFDKIFKIINDLNLFKLLILILILKYFKVIKCLFFI